MSSKYSENPVNSAKIQGARLEGQSPESSLDPTVLARVHSKSLTELEDEANLLILSAFNAKNVKPAHTPPKGPSRSNSSGSTSFTKMSLSSIMPSLTGLSLSRTSTNEDGGRGRRRDKEKSDGQSSRASSAMRSMSPFRRRDRTRERSPSVEALRRTDTDGESEADAESLNGRSPRNAFSRADQSDSESDEEDYYDQFDEETEDNTEKNATTEPLENTDELAEHEPDPLGEGVNVVRPEAPIFQPQPSIGHGTGPRRKKTIKTDALALNTGAPFFQRDRCSVTITHGEPAAYCVGKTGRRYMVASDLSEESKYAVEWGIGTVLKDGDEMTIVTVSETETKLDSTGAQADRMAKLRNQQERQALSYLLVRQATALLQRTKLNVTVKCQAIHAKNSRHMLLDLIDIIQPIMVIVGSRGVGKLKGILLGSTSHYLIQKSSVPVMVARRRLKRAVRHSQMPPPRTKHVSLAEATIEKAGKGSAEKGVQQLRDEIAEEEAARGQKTGMAAGISPTSPISPAMGSALVRETDFDSDSESEEGVKVAGE